MSALGPAAERYAIKEALPTLGFLCLLIVCRGLLTMSDAFVRFVFGKAEGLIGWVPFANRVLSRPIKSLEHKLSALVGDAEDKVDNYIGTSFHKLASIVRHMATAIEQNALATAITAAALGSYITSYVARKLFQKWLHPTQATVKAHTQQIARDNDMIRAQGGTLTRTVTHVNAVQAQAAVATGVVVGGRIGAREKAQDISIGRLWRWVRGRKAALTTGAFIGALAWSLGKLGIGWIRCTRNKRLMKDLACSPKADFLKELMEAGLLIVGTISIVELAEELQAEMGVAVDGITKLIRETHT